jgi:transcriptional regulator with XRE-family HTH domain
MEAVSLRKYFGAALERTREDAELSRAEIAAVLDVDPATVWRWETGDRWPRDPDVVAAVYGREGTPSALDLWDQAMRDARSAEARGDLERFLTEDFPTAAELHQQKAAIAEKALPQDPETPAPE